MICHDKKLIFIHIARTGGSSIERALIGQDWWFVEPETKHLSASQAKAIYGEDVWADYTKFSIVRNPWDRLVSMFARREWAANQTMDFRSFIENLRPHPNEKYNSLFYHEILDEAIDEVLRFESLNDDLNRLLSRSGLPAVELPYLERTERAHYSTYYDTETVEIVRRCFGNDIDAYGYEF